MAENSQGKKYGHEINFHGPYLDGQINLNFHIVSSSQDQITTIKEIADLIREEGTIPATGNYTYYEKQEESHEVEKKEVTEETKDEASGATPRPIMKIVDGIQVDGDGIKPIFAKEETSVEPKIMTMSLDSVSSTDDTIIYPTILSAEAPAVLADSSDDSKLITYGNLKAFAGLTDGRYVRLKSGDTAPGSYVTSTELSDLEDSVIKKGTLYLHIVKCNVFTNSTTGGSDTYTTGYIYLHFLANTSTKAAGFNQLRKVWGTGVWIPVFGNIHRATEDSLQAPIVGIRFSSNSFDLMSYPSSGTTPSSPLCHPIVTSGLSTSYFQVTQTYQVVPLVTTWALES